MTRRPCPALSAAESRTAAGARSAENLVTPFAPFGGVEAYPTLPDQAAVLLKHLAQNHPLPDANKRAASLLMARILDANGVAWGPSDVNVDAPWSSAWPPATPRTRRSSRGSGRASRRSPAPRGQRERRAARRAASHAPAGPAAWPVAVMFSWVPVG